MKFIVFIFLIGVFGIWIRLSVLNSRFQNTEKSQQSPSAGAIDWQIPPLPNNVAWESHRLKADELEDYLFMVESYVSLADPKSVDFLDYYLPGTVSISSTSFNGVGDANDNINLFLAYSDALEKNGWKQTVWVGNKKLLGQAADGVTGGSVGFVKAIKGSMRHIVVSHERKGDWSTSDSVGHPVLSCPCSMETTVYVSDVVAIDELERYEAPRK